MSSDLEGAGRDELGDSQFESEEGSVPAVHPTMGISMQVYPIEDQDDASAEGARPKRRQVKNACTNCQQACKKCDDARPCMRCVTYGLTDQCVSSPRKPRQRGIKRGPYKKRHGEHEDQQISLASPEIVQSGGPTIVGVPLPYSMPPTTGAPVPMMGAAPSAFYGAPQPVPADAGQTEIPTFHPSLVLVQQPLPIPGAEQPTTGTSAQPQHYYHAWMPYQLLLAQPMNSPDGLVYAPGVPYAFPAAAPPSHPPYWHPSPPSSTGFDEHPTQSSHHGNSPYED